MTTVIRHRRLSAFFHSKALNGLMSAVITSLLLMAYTRDTVLPVMCGSAAMLMFIAYALWIWVKKPKTVVINDCLSNINGLYTFYYLIAIGVDPANPWWYIIPIALASVPLLIALTNYRDERFDI